MNCLHVPRFISIILVFLGSLQWANCANILFFFAYGMYSHEIPIWPLAVRVADTNHSVTFLSMHAKKPWEDARIKLVATPKKIEEIGARYMADVFQLRMENQEFSLWKPLPTWSSEICEHFLTLEESDPLKNILWNDGEKFDLVFVDAVLCDCGHVLGYYHNAKVIVTDSSPIMPWFNHVYGFPTEASWLPGTVTFYQYPMTFFNMVHNYLQSWYWTYMRRTQLYPKLDTLIETVFKGKRDNIPSFLEMERKADLIFVNTHASVELPRSLPPNVIKIGGMQMWAQKKMVVAESINDFMENAEQGVILLSFGSGIDFDIIPEHLQSAFIEAFQRFPQIHFIIKAGVSTTPENAPKNVRYEQWIPQKEILAHPKTLGFITHAGLNGIMEATYYGVPLIAMPIFSEQDFEAYHMQARETGIRLEMRELTVDHVWHAIEEITTDPKYRTNMRKLQEAFRDRPEGNPLDLATKWTELVLKHEDLSFMNPITYQPQSVYLEQLLFSPHSFTIAAVSVALVTVMATMFSIKLFGIIMR